MGSSIYTRLDLTLEVMTPVHVWSGENLLYNLDIVVYGNQAYIIDLGKLAHILDEKNAINDLYSLLDQKEPNIIQLLRKHGILFRDVEKTSIPSKLRPQNIRSRFVKDHLRINNTPLIPGSEIKGLIRTALLNYLAGKGLLSSEIQRSLNLVLSNVNNRYFSLKGIDTPIQSFIKAKVFDTSLDLLRYIIVSDPIEHNVRVVLDSFITYKLFNRTVIVEEPLIILDKGTSIKYELIIQKPVNVELIKTRQSRPEDNTNYTYLIKLYNEYISLDGSGLFRSLKYFSEKLLEYEIKRLNRLSTANSFVSQLKEWRQEVENSNNVFYLRIGYGTNMYSKTLFLSLDPNDQKRLINAMSNIIKLKTRGRITIWDTLTAKITGSKYHYQNGLIETVGWVKITIKR